MSERDSAKRFPNGNRQRWVNGLPILGAIWLAQAFCDRLWFALDHSMPPWDPADYLTGALTYWNALQTPQWFSGEWWRDFWQLSTKIPPLVYISTAPFLSLFGAGIDQSTLVFLPYSAILLGSVYGLGTYLLNASVGLWAAGLCVLMPSLYVLRLEYLLDYPVAAMVALCFLCLTLWRGQTGTGGDRAIPHSKFHVQIFSYSLSLPHPLFFLPWLLAVLFGLSLGLALMAKQTTAQFLLVPMLWVLGETVWRRAWGRLGQLILASAAALAVFYPWYRTNWLLILTSSKKATIDSAIAEGAPPLLSAESLFYYVKALPEMVSWVLLVLPVVGLLFFWRRSRVSSQRWGEDDFAPKSRKYRQSTYAESQRSLGWLLVFLVGTYLLVTLNPNKDGRYIAPYLPVLAVVLAYGLTLLPKPWRWLRLATITLAIVLMLSSLFPLFARSEFPQRYGTLNFPDQGGRYPHAEVVAAVANADPYVRSTIGVLPSTLRVNQHNINYYGQLHNFQVYGRQVGTRLSQVQQDRRSLPWFLTKTGDQGSIRKPDPQTKLVRSVEQGRDFALHKTWRLPDGSDLRLYRRTVPTIDVRLMGEPQTVSVQPLNATAAPIQLAQVIVPAQALPGKPIPVTYRWVGSWGALQSGVVLLTWQKQQETGLDTKRWFHDHAIAQGALYAGTVRTRAIATQDLLLRDSSQFQVVERLAMLPSAQAEPGLYRLEALYLDRQTGKTIEIAAPPVTLRLDPAAPPTPAPELDLVTQLRELAKTLPRGSKALDHIFSEIARINQYDPVQDYVLQSQLAARSRLQQEPNNRDLAYTLALTAVLKRQVDPAIAALERVTQLDPQNPYASAYLAFVNLYDFRPTAAIAALRTVEQLNPTLPELPALKGIAALMRGDLIHAWQHLQVYQKQTQAAGEP